MNIIPIDDEAGYEAALKEIAPYFDNEPQLGSKEAERFEMLIASIQVYETQNFPLGSPNART